MTCPVPFNEEDRLQRLDAMAILDTEPNRRIDALTARALAVFPGASMAAVSLVGRDRQWFKSAVGLPVRQTPRSNSFCSHAILSDRTFVVPNAMVDRRFAANPLVVGEPNIRFYVGEPILNGLGALCVMGTQPRRSSSAETAHLVELARLVEAQILMENALRLLSQRPVYQA